MTHPIQFKHAWNQAYVPTNGLEKTYLLLEVVGTSEKNHNRMPINLSLVLDRSGSMHGSPLQFSKQACHFVIGHMSEEDILSMVAFDDQVSTVFTPEKVTHKDLMKNKVSSIEPGGTTNLSAGLIQGAQHVLTQKKDGFVRRVILLSDGHANEGIIDPQRLANIAKEYNQAGVGITTMGVGDGFDEELMETIADHGGGQFYYIERPDDIPSIFAKELDGLLSVIAQNVQLTIKPSNSVHIHSIYGYQVSEEDGAYTLQLGDIFSGEVKSILLEVSLAAKPEGVHDVLDVEWKYVDVLDTIEEVVYQYPISVEYTNNLNLVNESTNAHVEKQVQITQSALAIEQAMDAFDHGDFEKGQQILEEKAFEMSKMAESMNDSELVEESQMLYSHINNLEYTSAKRKELHQHKYRKMKRQK